MNKVSIIIPLLNQRDEWLEQCILSAVKQTVRLEVVVITTKNFTKESNIATIRKIRANFNNLKVLESEIGFAKTINKGIRESFSERIGLLLSDDWLELDAVEECLKYDADIVCTSAMEYADDGTTKFLYLSPIKTHKAFSEKTTLQEKASYLEHFFLFKREKLLEVGLLDENIGDCAVDDFDLIWTLLEHNAQVHLVEKYLYNLRDHDGERLTMRSKDEMTSTVGRILEKHGITGKEKKDLIAKKSVWFGKPEHIVRPK